MNCVGPRVNPGFTIGVNLKVGRFAVAPEIGVFLLPPDEYYAPPPGEPI
ncbi:MAG TPA: hypothetical protein VFS50_01925 [Meiothermus sp.]|nr:hypothetical protein [Meiothermus sp.]